jgi:hypothetical protein
LFGIWQSRHAERDAEPGQSGQDGHEQRYLQGEVPGLGVDLDDLVLAGPDADFAATTWADESTGHGRRERRSIRNLVTGAFRRAGYANIAHARRYYGRDDLRILALYGYA